MSIIFTKRLKLHSNAVHKMLKPFKCLNCTVSCVTNGALQKHIKTVHDKIKPHHCQVCKKAFGANSTLQKHIIRMHKKSVANQVSKVDKKRFKKSKSSTDKKYCQAKNRLLEELSTLVQDYLHQQGPESKPVKMSMLQS